MKFIQFPLVLSAMLLTTQSAIASQTQEELVQESHQIIQKFAKTLKGELKAGMKKGGPVNAIQVCNEKALQIGTTVSEENGVKLSRTSLKLRNQDNTPKAWEKTVLEQFNERHSKGESAKKMEFSEIVEVDGQKQYRYMKAMGVSKTCLNCHGSGLLPAVQEKITSLYPEDKAVGYDVGDIRGAIVLTKELN
ncbi:MAG: DUF3365 domain-containing protein [Gammaproteobacteria bacterium]|nr:DUF3365 domain-containing protein [Gammaproteobacteria bacterium]